MALSIDEMFAFIAVDEEGEGITGFKGPMGWMPMIGADMERIEQFRPIAQTLADNSGKRIVVSKFSTREDTEIIEPTGTTHENVVIAQDGEDAMRIEGELEEQANQDVIKDLTKVVAKELDEWPTDAPTSELAEHLARTMVAAIMDE